MKRALAGASLIVITALLGYMLTTETLGQADSVERQAPLNPEQMVSTSGLGRVAFVREGDIWTKDLPDGSVRRLTTSGDASEPHWSASGHWVAFRRVVGPTGPVEVWVMNGDGTTGGRLNQGNANISWFEWAPQQDQLAFVSASGSSFGTLEIIDASGANRKQLVSSGVGRVAWSPDGAWIAVDMTEIMTQGTPRNRRAAMQLVRPDGSGERELLNAGSPSPEGLLLAGWSGDGQHVVYWTGPGWSASLLADGAPVYAISAAGGQPRKLADAMLYHDDFWTVSPATSKLVVTDGSGRETWSHKRLAVTDADTGALSYLTASNTTAFSPAWSPDGGHLAYSAGPDIGRVGGGDPAKAGAAQRRIWVMHSGGGNQGQLTHDPAYRDERPLWSADGSHILFARVNAAGDQASLWLMAADGSQPRLVADGLAWSSKGEPLWFGYYGHIGWNRFYDWWPGVDATDAPVSGLPGEGSLINLYVLNVDGPAVVLTTEESGTPITVPCGENRQLSVRANTRLLVQDANSGEIRLEQTIEDWGHDVGVLVRGTAVLIGPWPASAGPPPKEPRCP